VDGRVLRPCDLLEKPSVKAADGECFSFGPFELRSFLVESL
jgi:hypothetical protein